MSRYHRISASATPRPPWFRGTRDGRLAPNAHGIVWLAGDYETAASYGPRVLEVRLSPSARVIDMRDLSNPVIRTMKDSVSRSREMNVGRPIPDGDWPKWADFGMLEGNGWAVPLLLEDRVAGVVVADSRGSSAVPHDSLALLDAGAVSSWEETGPP